MGRLTTFLLRLFSLRRRYIGLIAGAVLWVLWMTFGFWSLVLLAFLLVIGFFIGRLLETDLTWKAVIDKLLSHQSDS